MEYKVVLSPKKIVSKEFKVDFKGYNADEVDHFLDQVVKDYEAFAGLLNNSYDRIEQLERRLADQKAMIARLEREKALQDDKLVQKNFEFRDSLLKNVGNIITGDMWEDLGYDMVYAGKLKIKFEEILAWIPRGVARLVKYNKPFVDVKQLEILEEKRVRVLESLKMTVDFCDEVKEKEPVQVNIFREMMSRILMVRYELRHSLENEIKDKKDKAKLLEEFKEGMNAVAVALRAGYSVENAFIEAGKEMAVMSGGKSKVCVFFNYIKGQLSVNRNIEDALAVFADESGVTDIISFSEVFTYAKRSGGNMVEIIHDTVNTITLKADTAREISVLISAKQLEQIIMDIVPIGIILYLRITADELISKMYGNMYGITVMTVCLIVYVCAVIISMKISDIKV